MADPNEKNDKDNLADLINSIDTKEPEEMRPIWEGFSLDNNKQKK